MAIPKQRSGTDIKGMDAYCTTSSATHYSKGSIMRDELIKDAYKKGYDGINWSVKLVPKEKTK